MPRYIDANKIKYVPIMCYSCCDNDGNGNFIIEQTAYKSDIDKIPTEDVVQVVRCKDCKHFGKDLGYGKHDCKKYEMPYCLENDYCSYGERKE